MSSMCMLMPMVPYSGGVPLDAIMMSAETRAAALLNLTSCVCKNSPSIWESQHAHVLSQVLLLTSSLLTFGAELKR